MISFPVMCHKCQSNNCDIEMHCGFASVACSACGFCATVPFSLTCGECDDGMEINSPEEAIQLGWDESIDYDDGMAWNFIGMCPTCRATKETFDGEESGTTEEPSD